MQLFNLPNFLTLINLFSGCLAVVCLFSPALMQYVGIFTFVSLIADFFDGFAARSTNTKTNIGKELDSLADMVSFGLVPGILLFNLLRFYFISQSMDNNEWLPILYASPAFLITLFSALRLAKFNLDTRQSDSFMGLATPANTLFFLGLFYYFISLHHSPSFFVPYILYSLTVLFSFLLIEELPMFAFKFKSFRFKENKLQFLTIGFAILTFFLCYFMQFPFLFSFSIIIVFYILLSLFISFKNK